jgi:putative NADH-flavin reductase
MPHVLILGATGRAGSQLLRLALDKGFQVTVLVRSIEKLCVSAHPNLRIVEGSVSDSACWQSIRQKPLDGVLSTLGVFIKSAGFPMTELTKKILSELPESSRVVVMSSLGVGDSRGQGGLVVKYVTRIVLKYVLQDKEKQEQLIRSSSHRWTIIRPPRLLDSPESKPFKTWEGRNKPAWVKWKLSTHDAAVAMLNAFEQDSSIGRCLQISY